jgi:hypothetical protein
VLARVEVAGAVANLPLPVYAFLQDSAGTDYLLVIVSEARLRAAGWPWRTLERGIPAENLVIATEMKAGARAAVTGFKPLYDDGRRWLVEVTPAESERLAALGFALQRLGPEPVVLQPLGPAGGHPHGPDPSPMPDPLVRAMIQRVEGTNLWWLMRRLTGEEPVVAGGEPQLITSRITGSGTPLQKATELAFERFTALGLHPAYHAWSASGNTNRNVIATLPGTTRSNELVLITAHLDDMPPGSRAAGADDNASGSAAVITAAGVLSQCQFERTVRFVLFTGEEQGLYGSASYAGLAQTNGDNIVGVLNLDMLGWDSKPPATFQLHTRTVTAPGYSNDLALAATFTNAATVYALTPDIVPVVKADGLTASDHSSFWNRGYAAICAIEDYGADFNPYYHTVNDTLARMNMRYYTAAVRAAVASAAHLAHPVSPVPVDVVETVAGNWAPSNGIGSGIFISRHLPEAREDALDPFDLAVTNTFTPDPTWFKATTQPDGVELATDARPTNSESVFLVNLSVVTGGTNTLSSTNRLRFDFLAPPAPDRTYTARITIPQPAPGADFLCVTNVRQVVAQGGYVVLPTLQAFPGGTYGTCELATRFVDTTRAGCRLRVTGQQGALLLLATDAQVGARVVDDIEVSSTLDTASWVFLASFTNDVAPDPNSFDRGWQELARPVDLSSLTTSGTRFFRLRRNWLP